MKSEEKNQKSASDIQQEGQQVSGDTGSAENTNQDVEAGGEEAMPEADSKKEEISGYNEHPDQEKVGGG